MGAAFCEKKWDILHYLELMISPGGQIDVDESCNGHNVYLGSNRRFQRVFLHANEHTDGQTYLKRCEDVIKNDVLKG